MMFLKFKFHLKNTLVTGHNIFLFLNSKKNHVKVYIFLKKGGTVDMRLQTTQPTSGVELSQTAVQIVSNLPGPDLPDLHDLVKM